MNGIVFIIQVDYCVLLDLLEIYEEENLDFELKYDGMLWVLVSE